MTAKHTLQHTHTQQAFEPHNIYSGWLTFSPISGCYKKLSKQFCYAKTFDVIEMFLNELQ